MASLNDGTAQAQNQRRAGVVSLGQDQLDITAIQKVVQEDHEISEENKPSSANLDPKTDEDLDNIAQMLRNYVSQARQIDTSACPRDFAEAYYRHISAWSDEADTIAAHPHIPSDGEAMLQGFLHGLNGDLTGGVLEVQNEFKQWMQQTRNAESNVNDTWHEVEALEVRYGAK